MIVDIRISTLSGTGRNDRLACMSSACIALPRRDAKVSTGCETLHCAKTIRHEGKTTRNFTVDTRITAETTLHWANAPKHRGETTLH